MGREAAIFRAIDLPELRPATALFTAQPNSPRLVIVGPPPVSRFPYFALFGPIFPVVIYQACDKVAQGYPQGCCSNIKPEGCAHVIHRLEKIMSSKSALRIR